MLARHTFTKLMKRSHRVLGRFRDASKKGMLDASCGSTPNLADSTLDMQMVDPVRLSATIVFIGSIAMVFISAFVLGIDALVVSSPVRSVPETMLSSLIRLSSPWSRIWPISGIYCHTFPCTLDLSTDRGETKQLKHDLVQRERSSKEYRQ